MLTLSNPPAPAAPRPKAVVIGAGYGGLAAAIRLGAKGYAVTLLDRLDAPGGRATSHREGGYRFDLGPTIVTAPQVFRALWTEAGADFDADVDLRPLSPFYEIRFQDGSRFRASGDAEEMRAEVARLSPGDAAGYDRFMADARERYTFGFENLGQRPMHQLWELVKTLPRFAMLRADRSVHAHAARRVSDPRLRMALSFHPLFIGGDPFRVTSIYALVAHLEREYGVHYAMGGAGALAEAMARLVERLGGEVRQNVDVDEILTRDGRAIGVTTMAGERLDADIVVSNADPETTYSHLLRRKPKRRWTPARFRRSRWSMGLYIWYFGTKGTRGDWADVGHHTILNGPRYEGLVRDIFRRGKLAQDMSVYLHRPTVTDPSAAPDGDDSFYALAPVPHIGHPGAVDWATEAEPFRQRLLRMLEDGPLPGLSDRIAASHVMTPADFVTRYRAPMGTGFSLEPRILQSAWFRPHNFSEELRGLHLVGAGCHPGAGLPGVLSSADVMAQCVPDAPQGRVAAHPAAPASHARGIAAE